MHTPENITSLAPHEIFVFGSNIAGNHAGGAARIAYEKFGAEWGVGEGLTGQCYALPTLGAHMEKRNNDQLTMSIERLFEVAKENPNKSFLLTKVGCGIAGYDESYIKLLFQDSPQNIVKPKGW